MFMQQKLLMWNNTEDAQVAFFQATAQVIHEINSYIILLPQSEKNGLDTQLLPQILQRICSQHIRTINKT